MSHSNAISRVSAAANHFLAPSQWYSLTLPVIDRASSLHYSDFREFPIEQLPRPTASQPDAGADDVDADAEARSLLETGAVTFHDALDETKKLAMLKALLVTIFISRHISQKIFQIAPDVASLLSEQRQRPNRSRLFPLGSCYIGCVPFLAWGPPHPGAITCALPRALIRGDAHIGNRYGAWVGCVGVRTLQVQVWRDMGGMGGI